MKTVEEHYSISSIDHIQCEMRWRCRCPTVAAGFQTREVRRNENDQGQQRRWRRLTKLVKNRNIETLTNNDDNDCWRWWLKHFVVRLREKTCSPNSSAGRTSFCVFLSHMAYVINDSTINMIFCVIIITTICSILSQICDEATKHNSLENIHVLGLQFLHFFMHDHITQPVLRSTLHSAM